MTAMSRKVRVARIHPLGRRCARSTSGACYFDNAVISTEYWRPRRLNCPASKEEVAAFARSALLVAIQNEELPMESIDARIEVVTAPPWDPSCLDYRVSVNYPVRELRSGIKAAVQAGLIPFNAQWDAEDVRTSKTYSVMAYQVYVQEASV